MKILNYTLHSTIILVITTVILISCGTSKPIAYDRNLKSVKKDIPTKTEEIRILASKFSGKNSIEINLLLKDAQKYLGAPYKLGGTSFSGFDCSGFTLKVFEQNAFRLPRTSSEQAQVGNKIDVEKVRPGDLLFFATSGGGKVSHVGIVYDIGIGGEVKFIHASTSKGVIISSLNERYWNKAYLHATRIL